MLRTIRTLLLASLLLACAVPTAQAAVGTLATIRGKAIGFAQDGSYLGWYSRHSSGCQLRVVRFDVKQRTGTQIRCAKQTGSVGLSRRTIAVNAQGRLTWSETLSNSRSVYMRVWTDTLTTKPSRIQEIAYDATCGNGDYLQAISGDSSTLVWSTQRFDAVRAANGTCAAETLAGGSVWTVNGSLAAPYGGITGSDLIAAGGTRFAQPEGANDAEIVVRNSSNGNEIARVVPAGDVVSLALGGSYVVALVREPDTDLFIKRWNANTGAVVGSTQIGSDSSGPITTNGKWVTYRNGLNLRKLRITDGSTSSVATLKRAPIGYRIDGTRAAWIQPLGSKRFAVQYTTVS
jgi:hypothetical protein